MQANHLVDGPAEKNTIERTVDLKSPHNIIHSGAQFGRCNGGREELVV